MKRNFFNIGSHHPYDASPSIVLTGDEKREWTAMDQQAENEGEAECFLLQLGWIKKDNERPSWGTMFPR